MFGDQLSPTFQYVPEKNFPRWPGREADNARLAIPPLPHTSTWRGVYDRTALRFTLTVRDKNALCLGFWTNCINGTHNAEVMSESRGIVCVKLMHGVETSCRDFTPKVVQWCFRPLTVHYRPSAEQRSTLEGDGLPYVTEPEVALPCSQKSITSFCPKLD